MITYDLKFLTCDEGVNVKNTDFKAFKYETKKKSEETVYDAGKKSYCKSRNGFWRPPKARGLRDLEAKLRDGAVTYCEWMNENLVVMVFSNGTIAYLTINTETLDVTHILFDRYCVGKLSGQIITGVVFTATHILFTHIESTATLVTLCTNKPDNNKGPCRIADRNPHIQIIDLADGARRAERHLSWAEDHKACSSRVLIWTTAGAEPAPWTPGAEIQANLHLYQISGQQMSVIAYHQMENETLLAEISKENHNMIHIVEQIICHKSYVTLEWTRATLSPHARLSTLARQTARLPASARRAALHEAADRVLVACIDGSLHSVHAEAGLTHSTRADFVPTALVACGGAVLCADDARVQCYDRALTLLQRGAKCLQLAAHFRHPPQMRVLGARACGAGGGGGAGAGGAVVALHAGGTLALLRVSHPDLIKGWLRAGRAARAVALLGALDWRREGDRCLRALHDIFEWVCRRGVDAGGEAALQAALGTYLARSPPPAARRRPVLDLARRFHHQLLRRGRLDKALSLGVDVGAWDLFADARRAAAAARRPALAAEARALMAQYADAPATESECSESCSCSGSETDSSAGAEPPPPPLPRVPAPAPAAAPAPAPAFTPPPGSHPAGGVRPHLHQYLESSRAPPPWTGGRPGGWMTALDADYRRGLREASHLMYRYRDASPAEPHRAPPRPAPPRPEKNVKFADTVSVAEVPALTSDGGGGGGGGAVQPARELADSLPLCAPHAYLAAFEPSQRAGTTPDRVHV